ncbi:Ras family protein [Tritrichomonas foetus]|uniref:Ras family protein n=1 Tax=Tritrichomonas foetus TaxID=1144522 RepID=A0A1J4L2S1_9EUKA|nr:Ras family protein [Tritrichomonas foetus]|eukprot:OHT17392.1 Ras family protein [Tritrichomonas foetus]
MIEQPDATYKIVVVGASGVGKTAIVQRLVEDVFSNDKASTIGVEFTCYSTKIGDETVKLNIWDTAGQEKFRSVSRAYFRNAVGALLVFSYTDQTSFEELDSWLNDLQVLSIPNAVILLVGNKTDLTDSRTVSAGDAEAYAERNGIDFIETSALAATNVTEAFIRLAAKVHEKVKKREIQSPTLQPKSNLNLSNQSQNTGSSSGCC